RDRARARALQPGVLRDPADGRGPAARAALGAPGREDPQGHRPRGHGPVRHPDRRLHRHRAREQGDRAPLALPAAREAALARRVLPGQVRGPRLHAAREPRRDAARAPAHAAAHRKAARPRAAGRRLPDPARPAADGRVRDAVLVAHLGDTGRGPHGERRGGGALRRRDPRHARRRAGSAARARERAVRDRSELLELRLQEQGRLRRRRTRGRARLDDALCGSVDRGGARARPGRVPRAGLQVTWRLALLLLAAASLVPASQARIDQRTGTFRAQEEVLYLWSGEHVRRLVPGFESLAADIYWLRTVQYFGGQRLFVSGKRFELL